MYFFWLFFVFHGRISRAEYWKALFALLALNAVLIGMAFIFVGPYGQLQSIHLIIAGLVIAIASISGLALSAKRFHDRNRSGWFVLLLNVPNGLIGIAERVQNNSLSVILWLAAGALGIWLFIELGCKRGTEGSNRFGLNPFDKNLEPVAV